MELKATGVQWQTGQELWRYKNVKTGSIKVGDVNVPIYGHRWKKVDTFYQTGNDNNPIPAHHFDCSYQKPEDAKLGDEYCVDTDTIYYLVFEGYDPVVVTVDIWSQYSPYHVYKVRETLFGLEVLPDE